MRECARPGPLSLSKHTLIGYWHNFSNPSGPTFPLADVCPDWDIIVVAFANDLGHGYVGFTLDPSAGSEEQFIQDIQNLHASGKRVILSIGGQNGAISLQDELETQHFVESVHGLLIRFGFAGLDVDLETGMCVGSKLEANLIRAIKQLKQRTGDHFYLSMAPEHPYVQGGFAAYGGIWGAYLPIIDALRDELTVVHVQYYNNGGFVYVDGSTLEEGTVDALVGGSLMLLEGFCVNRGTGWHFHGLRPDQVAFGVPSGRQSAGRGFATPETVARALRSLIEAPTCSGGRIQPKVTYPSFRGVMTWSINWDKHDKFSFSKSVRHALDGLSC